MSTERDVELSGAAWVALQAIVAGRAPGEDGELVSRGLVVEGRLTPRAEALLAPFREAVAVVRVGRGGPDETREATVWVSADRACLAELTVGESVRLRALAPGYLPLLLGGLVQLRPSPLPALVSSQAVPAAWLLALAGANGQAPVSELAAEIRPLWPEIADEFEAGSWHWWAVEAFALEDDKARLRGSVFVLDTGAGLLGIDLGAAEATLTPIAPTDAWRRLTFLVAPSA
ncbi:MAG: hypothetical protein Q3997_00160 [Propionibacteriaceae bacterium]|nr:hypothetical protein [Propionibacteriaceae bacterium]